ncbi:MAG: ribosome biogenesis GTPase Der [Bifidobacteriaceae bacterium]|jgi:GTP-binding protein|nr:ribosome biogenesis GTPase Der [Bifidobacteriaceae bacterium]
MSIVNVAVVGRPNVGKSTFINRIIQARQAIVQNQPGVTRDRVSYPANWNGRDFNLIDTAGWKSKQIGIDQAVVYQSELAIASSDIVIFMVDLETGIVDEDEKIVHLIRRSKKTVLLVVNKVDNAKLALEVAQFYALGLGEPFGISALQGRDIGDFLDLLVSHFDQAVEQRTEELYPKIAIVGKPNVGKSSLFNYLSKSIRTVVDNAAGTTRDTIDQNIEVEGNLYTLIDTAGLKKRYNKKEALDYYSSIRTNDAIFRCDLALVLFDATQPISDQDLQIVYQVVEQGKSLVILLNKYDLLDDYQKQLLKTEVETRLDNLDWIPLLRVSALTGWHVGKIFDQVLEVLTNWNQRISTHQLNVFLEKLVAAHPHPIRGGKQPKIRYATQAATKPPKILLFTTAALAPTYLRFIERKIRETFGFRGSPIRLVPKVKVKR